MTPAAILTGIVVLFGFAMYRQQAAADRLRTELAHLVQRTGGLKEAREDNWRLAQAEPSGTELAWMRSEHAALDRLRRELASLAPTDAPELRPAVSAEPNRPEPLAYPSDAIIAARATNAGRQSVGATMETLLWAASSGHLETLKALIKVPAQGRFEDLASDPRADQIVSLIAADAAPFSAIKIASVHPDADSNIAALRSRLQASEDIGTDPEKWKRQVSFILTHEPGGWGIVLTNSTLEKYRARLADPNR